MTSLIIWDILFTASWDCSASFLTSSATTANPLPCSPALADSIAAFNARRLVWDEISLIRFTIPSISLDLSPKVFIKFLVFGFY